MTDSPGAPEPKPSRGKLWFLVGALAGLGPESRGQAPTLDTSLLILTPRVCPEIEDETTRDPGTT
jgi:hypothetical protein